MNSTRLGVRPLGRATVAYALVLVLALSIVAPGTAVAQGMPPFGPPAGDSSMTGRVYIVQYGDTLNSIARRFGVTVEDLMRANGLRNPNFIYVGQALTIPGGGGGGGTGGPGCTTSHTVRFGETASQIAQRYGISLQELARANNLTNSNRIFVGQVLCIPGGGSSGQPLPWPIDPNIPQPGQPQPWPIDPNIPQPGQPQPWSIDPNIPQPGQPLPWPIDPNIPQPGQPGPKQPVQPIQPKPAQPVQPVQPLPWPLDSNIPQPGPQQPVNPPQCGAQPGGGWSPDCPGQTGPDRPSQQPDLGFWRGSYFKDKYFSEFVEERQDSEIRFNWYKGSPGDNMPEDRFSIRWERVLNFDGGDYRFYATADDGVRVYVDDTLVIDGWKIQPATEYTGDISLRPGKHKVVVEYYEEAEDALINVYWEPKREYRWD